MGRLLVQVLALVAGSTLIVLWGFQRPSQMHRDYRPSTSEIWSTATDVASSAVSVATDAASSAFSSASELVTGSGSPSNDAAVQSAIAGCSAVMQSMPAVFSEPATELSSASPGVPAVASLTADLETRKRLEALEAEATALRALLKKGTAATAVGSADPAKLSRPAEVVSNSASVSATSAAALQQTVAGEVPAVPMPASSCNRDYSKPLSPEDVLCRVPRGELAYISLANAAYGEMAVNWALLLLPMLEKVGHGERAVLAALDLAGVEMFVKRKVPTMSTEGFGGIKFNMNTRGHMDGFRWGDGRVPPIRRHQGRGEPA